MKYRSVYKVEHEPIPLDTLDRIATRASHRTETYVIAATEKLACAAFTDRCTDIAIKRISFLCSADIEVEVSG